MSPDEEIGKLKAARAWGPKDPRSNVKVKAPVLGLSGGLKEDARIGATIAPTDAKMKALKRTFAVHVFEGAAHGFLRAESGNHGANMKAPTD